MVDDTRQHFNISREALGLPQEQSSKREPGEKVVKGTVVTRKKPVAMKLVETFFGGDLKEVAMDTIKSVFIPAAKNMIYDTLCAGGARILWHEDVQSANGRTNYAGQYNRHYNARSVGGTGARNVRPTTRTSTYADDIILPTREDAQSVLNRMYDLLDQYGQVSLSDLYDACGITGDFTAEKWGWRSLQTAQINEVRGGFKINLPSMEQL